jgi:hypothetical protein
MKNFYLKLILISTGLFLFNQASYSQALPWAWVHQTYNGSEANAKGMAIDNTNQVVYIAGTYSTGPIDFGQGPISGSSYNDIFIAKYTVLGQLLWAKVMGNMDNGLSDVVTGLALDPSGNIYMTGYTTYDSIRFGTTLLFDTTTGSSLGFLAKFDDNGNPQWAQAGVPANSSSLSEATAVTTDASGNVYTIGFFEGQCTFGTTVLTVGGGAMASMYEIKYSSSGNIVWTQTGLGYTDGWPTPNAITLDKYNNSIVAGNYGGTQCTLGNVVLTNTNASFDDRFVTKIDSDGNFLWAKGAGYWQGPDINNSVGIDSLGNIYLVGFTSDPVYGPNNSGYQTAYFIEKLGAAGDSTSYTMVPFDFSSTILGNLPVASFDAGGNTYMLLSTMDSSWTFGSLSGGVHYPYISALQTEGQGSMSLVVKFDNNLNPIWIQNTAPSGVALTYENLAEVSALDNNGNLYVSGFFSDTIAYGSIIISNTQDADFYIAKIGYGAAGINEIQSADIGYTIYPNPSNGQFQVHFKNSIESAEIRLYDMMGNIISYTGSGSPSNVMINEQGQLKSGAYICRVTTHTTGDAMPSESSHTLVIE